MSAFAARLAATCPATVSTIATTCTGSAGPLVLEARSLPWVGSTYRWNGTGFAANSFAATVVGSTSPGIPLSALDPGGLPNCFLLASVDELWLATPAGGIVAATAVIPRDPAFFGLQVYQQLLQAEFSAGGAVSFSSSNALRLTIGVF